MSPDNLISLDSLEQWEALVFKHLTVTTKTVKDTNYSKVFEDKRISNLGQNNFTVSNLIH